MHGGPSADLWTMGGMTRVFDARIAADPDAGLVGEDATLSRPLRHRCLIGRHVRVVSRGVVTSVATGQRAIRWQGPRDTLARALSRAIIGGTEREERGDLK